MELKIDENIMTKAAAQAIMAMLGDDPERVLAAFIEDILNAPKPNQYGSQTRESRFQQILAEEIDKYTRLCISEWLTTQKKNIDGMVREAFTQERLTQHVDTMVEMTLNRLSIK